MATLTCGNAALPEPVELSTSDEIIWSANTERSSSGDMIGEAIAEKKTWISSGESSQSPMLRR